MTKEEEQEEYKKRKKALIERVEKGENSPEMYLQLLDKIGQVKQKAFSKMIELKTDKLSFQELEKIDTLINKVKEIHFYLKSKTVKRNLLKIYSNSP